MIDNKVKSRIVTTYRSASGEQMREGISWYPRYHRLAANSPVGSIKGAGVMAAISPNKRPKHIMSAAQKIFLMGTADKTGLGSDKANRILKGECPTKVLGGRLTLGLYESILYPHGDITPRVDKYSYELAIGKLVDRSVFERTMRNDNEFKIFADSYRAAADELSVSVPQVQAITWCVWRDKFYPRAQTKKD